MWINLVWFIFGIVWLHLGIFSMLGLLNRLDRIVPDKYGPRGDEADYNHRDGGKGEIPGVLSLGYGHGLTIEVAYIPPDLMNKYIDGINNTSSKSFKMASVGYFFASILAFVEFFVNITLQ